MINQIYNLRINNMYKLFDDFIHENTCFLTSHVKKMQLVLNAFNYC